jgi:hypothetical protein
MTFSELPPKVVSYNKTKMLCSIRNGLLKFWKQIHLIWSAICWNIEPTFYRPTRIIAWLSGLQTLGQKAFRHLTNLSSETVSLEDLDEFDEVSGPRVLFFLVVVVWVVVVKQQKLEKLNLMIEISWLIILFYRKCIKLSFSPCTKMKILF